MFDYKNLPTVLVDFLTAQNEFNSTAFEKNFADDATVHDEGKHYYGTSEIKRWNETTNEKYHTKMEPIAFKKDKSESILTVMMSGTFDGSPLPANFHFVIKKEKIVSLKVE